MLQIEKTILTLVALLAVTTGAWADGIVCTASDLGKVLCTDGSIYENVSAATTAGKTAAAVIAYVDETNKNGLAIALSDEGEMNWSTAKSTCEGKTAVSGVAWLLPSVEQWRAMFWAFGGNDRSYTGLNNAITTAGGTALQGFHYYWSSTDEGGDNAYSVYLVGDSGGADLYEDRKSGSSRVRACLAFDIAPAPSGPEVDWNKTSKTGQFTMPGGNVELEPEYYPQATVADGGVTAADADARATTDDPLVKVDATKLTGAKKLMYFVSNSGTTAPAYDAEGWTDQLPTAEGFTQQGIVYVWYYPVGIDEGVDGATATYSDGDICLQSITARIAAAPTYAVTFAEGVNPEPPAEPEWTASPNADVKKGTEVTVTYTGAKKVLGVKAEKKAAAVSLIVNPVVGQIIGSDGNNYDADALLPTGVTAVAKICYVGSETGVEGYTHGLALALTDEASAMNWTTATGASGAAAHTPAAPTTTSSWMLPSRDQWEKMITAAGGYTALGDGFSGISGASNMQSKSYYWSSTEEDATHAWDFKCNEGNWTGSDKSWNDQVRACLAF